MKLNIQQVKYFNIHTNQICYVLNIYVFGAFPVLNSSRNKISADWFTTAQIQTERYITGIYVLYVYRVGYHYLLTNFINLANQHKKTSWMKKMLAVDPSWNTNSKLLFNDLIFSVFNLFGLLLFFFNCFYMSCRSKFNHPFQKPGKQLYSWWLAK